MGKKRRMVGIGTNRNCREIRKAIEESTLNQIIEDFLKRKR